MSIAFVYLFFSQFHSRGRKLTYYSILRSVHISKIVLWVVVGLSKFSYGHFLLKLKCNARLEYIIHFE